MRRPFTLRERITVHTQRYHPNRKRDEDTVHIKTR